jgi:predicted ester cyclase
MSQDIHTQNKQLIGRLRAALYDCDAAALKRQLREVLAADCEIHLASPFEDLAGPDALFEQGYQPLLAALPDLERRDFIVVGGAAGPENWVGCAGFYTGVFEQPWLGIPPTQHAIGMRFHEFFRVEDGQVVEMQAVWDIPQVMLQAQAWPLAPSLGVEWLVPGPATQDGLPTAPADEAQTEASVRLVREMLAAMGRHPREGGPEVMALERYWHPKMNWYGPAGIGTARRVAGFRHWHQIPFLKAMPDRGGSGYSAKSTLFGDGNYVATTGWPNMQMTLSGDGWLGIAPGNQKITMRSLDFWRCEQGRLRENWVLVDLLHVYRQLGVDVFARMRELTYARQPRR